jgi:porphobilinogen synthase
MRGKYYLRSFVLKMRGSQRPSRLRATPAMRAFTAETTLTAADFVYPLFVFSGAGEKQPISSMPGQYRFPVSQVVEEVQRARAVGVTAFLLFGIPAKKDVEGSEAWSSEGAIQEASRLIKAAVPGVLVITDLCLCEYTSSGACGVVRDDQFDEKATLKRYADIAVSQAMCGADIVAPSGMMDGMVAAIREALDQNGKEKVAVMSYAVTYASALYGPFREAAQSCLSFGDRKGHQMQVRNQKKKIIFF